MSYSPLIIASYSITSVLLGLNLLFLWSWSGVARARSGTVVNSEDGAKYGKPVQELDPAEVARVMRAHANAAAMIYPFLLIALAYVLLNGNPLVATVVFAAFCITRFAHSIAYLGSVQPWRSIAFGLSMLALLVLMALVVLRAIEVAAVG